jgi:hypothetical protein
MIEGLAFAILKTLSTFLFEQYLHTTVQVEIDGAPSWYYQEESNQLCTFSYRDGDYSQINPLKQDLQRYIKRDIQTINDKVIYENFAKITRPEERRVVEQLKSDSQLSDFIRFNIQYPKITYEDEVNRVFGKGCIQKSKIVEYTKKRLQVIVKEVSLQKERKAFNELESDNIDNSYFQEMEAGF